MLYQSRSWYKTRKCPAGISPCKNWIPFSWEGQFYNTLTCAKRLLLMAQASSSRIVMGRVSITSFFCSREDRMRGKRDRGATHIFLSALAPPVPPRDGSASCSHAAAGPPLEPRQLSEFMHELAMSWPNLSGTGPTAAMCEVTISEAACASACKIVVQIFI